MSNLNRYRQSATELLDRDFDFSEWLAGRSDQLASHEVIVSPSGLTVSLSSNLVAAGTVKVWLTGGTPGVAYRVTVRATTAAGRKKEASIVIRIR